jgi:predicted negative regulator of RcsB-dependent stress response
MKEEEQEEQEEIKKYRKRRKNIKIILIIIINVIFSKIIIFRYNGWEGNILREIFEIQVIISIILMGKKIEEEGKEDEKVRYNLHNKYNNSRDRSI